jgi:hypothetical protein
MAAIRFLPEEGAPVDMARQDIQNETKEYLVNVNPRIR